MKIWRKMAGFVGCKYLVVRRDGTIPKWPYFVIGGDDPNAPATLRAYADAADANGLDPEYAASIREMADEWEARDHSGADPDAPPHRTDNPDVIRMMQGEFDLKDYRRAAIPPGAVVLPSRVAESDEPGRVDHGELKYDHIKMESE